MPQKYEKVEDDPRYKVASPEEQRRIRRIVYGLGTEAFGPLKPPILPGGTVPMPKVEMKPYEKNFLENFRDWNIRIPVPGKQLIPPLENVMRTVPGVPTEEALEAGRAEQPINYEFGDYRPLPKPSDVAYFDLPVGGKAMMEELPQAAGIGVGAIGSVGGLGGTIGGYGLGALAGMGLRRDLQRTAPEFFGDPTGTSMAPGGEPLMSESQAFASDLLNDAPGHALNALFPALKLAMPGSLGAPMRERTKARFLQTWFKDKLTPDQRAALLADEAGRNFPITVGQSAKDEVKENTYRNAAKQEFVEGQTKATETEGKRLIDQFAPYRETPKKKGEAGAYELAQFEEGRRTVKEALRGQIEAAGLPNRAYFNWDSKKKTWVESSVPGNAPTQKMVDSPIRLTKTSEYADKTLAHLDELTARFKDTPLLQTGEIGRIKRYLEGFKGTGKEKKLNVEPFRVVEDARDALDSLINKTASHGEVNATLVNLRDNLDTDIQNSIRRWGQGSLDKYKELKDAITFERGVLGPDVQKSARQDPSKFFKGAFENEESARRFALSTRVAQETGGKYTHIKGADNPMAAEYLQQMMNKYGGNRFFRGEAAKKAFEQDLKKNIPQQFMDADQTQQIKHFFERSAIPKPVTAIGAYSLEQGKSQFFIRVPGLRQAVILGHGEFAKRVLMNPKTARIAAKLLDMPKDSTESKVLLRSLYSQAKLWDVGKRVTEDEAREIQRQEVAESPGRGGFINQ